MGEVKKNTGIVSIHGKEYQTVAKRIADFRADYPQRTIACELIESNDERVVMKASILEGDLLISTGYAEEKRDASTINQTSALENCETSAVGRALAFFGMAGTEIASADEVAQAISQQELKAHKEMIHAKWRSFTDALLDNHASVVAVKQFMADGDLSSAKEAWQEVEEGDRKALALAWTKGGVFTPDETNIFKSNDYSAA